MIPWILKFALDTTTSSQKEMNPMLKTQKLQDAIRGKEVTSVSILQQYLLTFTQGWLCVRNYAKHFAYIILFNPRDKFKMLISVNFNLIVLHIYQRGE